MSSLKHWLLPSRQNAAQRQGYFGTLAIAILVLFLHFPFEGYVTEHYVVTRIGVGPCPNPGLEEIKQMSREQSRQHWDDMLKCSSAEEEQFLPFTEWRSKSPISSWFSSAVHVIAAFVFVLFLGGIWLWIFRSQVGDEGKL